MEGDSALDKRLVFLASENQTYHFKMLYNVGPPATLCLLVYKPLYIKFLRATISPTVIAFMFTNLAIERGPHIASMSDDLVTLW